MISKKEELRLLIGFLYSLDVKNLPSSVRKYSKSKISLFFISLHAYSAVVLSRRSFYGQLNFYVRLSKIGATVTSSPSFFGQQNFLIFYNHLEDEMQLVLDGRAGEERPAGGHLVENAADAPHVDGGGVLRGAEEDVRGPVPEGDHLVGVRLRRDGLGAGEAEVGKLEKGEREEF